jgi:hypothetical protein
MLGQCESMLISDMTYESRKNYKPYNIRNKTYWAYVLKEVTEETVHILLVDAARPGITKCISLHHSKWTVNQHNYTMYDLKLSQELPHLP